NFAHTERDLGNLDQARQHIETALAITESLRIKIASQQLRASYFATTQKYHEFNIDLLMQLHRLRPAEGNDAAALRANERARARGLLEMLAEAQADINQGIDGKLLERERLLQRQINVKAESQYRLLSDKHSQEQMEAVKRDLNALIDDLQQVQAQIRNTNTRYAELNYPQPLSLPEIQQLLDSETLLLEYALGEKRSYLWAVTPDSISSFELPRRSEIEALARQAYELQSRGGTIAKKQESSPLPKAKYSEVASALGRILINPVSALLGKKRLLVVADGSLQYLPFATLPEPGSDSNPLIVDHEIVILPSTSSLAVLRRDLRGRAQAPKLLAVLADPVFDDDDVRIKLGAGKPSMLAKTQSTRSGKEQKDQVVF